MPAGEGLRRPLGGGLVTAQGRRPAAGASRTSCPPVSISFPIPLQYLSNTAPILLQYHFQHRSGTPFPPPAPVPSSSGPVLLSTPLYLYVSIPSMPLVSVPLSIKGYPVSGSTGSPCRGSGSPPPCTFHWVRLRIPTCRSGGSPPLCLVPSTGVHFGIRNLTRKLR